MTAPVPPSRARSKTLDRLRVLGHDDFGVDVRDRIAERVTSLSREPAPPPAPRPRRPWAIALAGGVPILAALALSWFGRPSNPSEGMLVVVGGPESLHSVPAGADRSAEEFRAGTLLPFGIWLEPGLGRGAAVRMHGIGDLRIDPGTRFSLEREGNGLGRVLLAVGRIEADVRASGRPLCLRVAGADQEIRAERAAFGILASSDGRWSAVVESGTLSMPGGPTELIARRGQRMGGTREHRVRIEAVPDRLVLESRVEERGGRRTLRGLSDWLARVEADGRELSLSSEGAFSFEMASTASVVHLLALDASGRRVAKDVPVVALEPQAAPAPGSAEPERPPSDRSSARPKQATPRAMRRSVVPSRPPTHDALAPLQEERWVPLEAEAPRW